MSSGKGKKTAPAHAGSYRVNVGLNYGPDDRRAEPGEVVSDLPSASIKWLVKAGHITPVDDAPVEGDH